MLRLEATPNAHLYPENLGIRWLQPTHAERKVGLDFVILTALLVILLTVFIYSLFIYLSIRQRIYLYFLLSNFTGFDAVLNKYGLIYFWLPDWHGIASVSTPLYLISNSLGFLPLILFAMEFFKTRERFPGWHKFFRLLLLAYTLLSPTYFIDYELGVLVSGILLTLIFGLGFLTVSVRSLQKGYPSSSYFLIGQLILWAGLILEITGRRGFFVENPWTDRGYALGLAGESLLFSLALADQINVLRRRNEKQQRKIIEQLQEREQIQSQINRELEAKVSERTETIRQQNLELQELDRAKSRFFANVSHELRTPLTLILNPLEAVARHGYGEVSPEAQKMLELANRNGQQLKGLVDEMLNLSRLEKGHLDMNWEWLPLETFIRRIYSAFESQAAIKELGYTLTFPPELEAQAFHTDPDKLEKILNNLLSNAFKFTPQGGQIDLRLGRQGKASLLIEVVDNGRGIPEMDLPKVFDRYFQSRQTNAPLEGGTGIGLALAHEYVKALQGEIAVESVWGTGSRFSVKLPAQLRTASHEEAGSGYLESPTESLPAISTAALPEPAPGTRIMIVEDNRDMRQYLQAILSPHYHVMTAANGKVALEMLQADASNIELIVSDVMMPEMDGLRFLEAFKQVPQWGAIPVIMLTALSREQDKLSALRIGVDDYLTKPFSVEELQVRIANLIHNASQRKAYREELPEDPGYTLSEAASRRDQEWIQKVVDTFLLQLLNSQYTLDQLADDVHVHPKQLFRKIKLLTGFTPNQFLREIRLDQARRALEKRHYNSVKEVARAVGYKDQHYFSTQYTKRYGKRPSAYF